MRDDRMLRIALLLFAPGCLALTPALQAGELEPPGPPAPTMKSLDLVPPTWSQLLDSTDGDPQSGCDSSRFRCVMNDDGVLDLETGLTWEREPTTETADWFVSMFLCLDHNGGGGRKGWRLPSVEELLSVLDPAEENPALPPGHPFKGGLFDPQVPVFLWTATEFRDVPGEAVMVHLSTSFLGLTLKSADLARWCVRGGSRSEQ